MKMAKAKFDVYHVDAAPRAKIKMVQSKTEISDSEVERIVSEIDDLFCKQRISTTPLMSESKGFKGGLL